MLNDIMKNYMEVFTDYVEISEEAMKSFYYFDIDYTMNNKEQTDKKDCKFGFYTTRESIINKLHSVCKFNTNMNTIDFDKLLYFMNDIKEYLNNYSFEYKKYHDFKYKNFEKDEQLCYNLSILDIIIIFNELEKQEKYDLDQNPTLKSLIKGTLTKDDLIDYIKNYLYTDHRFIDKEKRFTLYLDYLLSKIDLYEPKFFSIFKSILNTYSFDSYYNAQYEFRFVQSIAFCQYVKFNMNIDNVSVRSKIKLNYCNADVLTPISDNEDNHYYYDLEKYVDSFGMYVKKYIKYKDDFIFKDIFQYYIPSISIFLNLAKSFQLDSIEFNKYDKLQKSFNELIKICKEFYFKHNECKTWMNKTISKLNINKITPNISLKNLLRPTSLQTIFFLYLKKILDTDYKKGVDLTEKYGLTDDNVTKIIFLGVI